MLVCVVDIMKMVNDFGLKMIYDMDDWIIDLLMYSVMDLSDDLFVNIMWMVCYVFVVIVLNWVF